MPQIRYKFFGEEGIRGVCMFYDVLYSGAYLPFNTIVEKYKTSLSVPQALQEYKTSVRDNLLEISPTVK